MKLYYAPGACSLAPHIALREADRRFDLERVELASHRTSSGADFDMINPRGYVPALQLDGAEREVLVETQVILEYIADLAPDKQLAAPPGTRERYHLQSWLGFVASEIHASFKPLVARTPAPAAVRAQHRSRIGERFLYLEDVLSDRAFLLGERYTIADIYLFATLTWCEKVGIDLEIYPCLDDYAQRIEARPAVGIAMMAEGLHLRGRWQKSA